MSNIDAKRVERNESPSRKLLSERAVGVQFCSPAPSSHPPLLPFCPVQHAGPRAARSAFAGHGRRGTEGARKGHRGPTWHQHGHWGGEPAASDAPINVPRSPGQHPGRRVAPSQQAGGRKAPSRGGKGCRRPAHREQFAGL